MLCCFDVLMLCLHSLMLILMPSRQCNLTATGFDKLSYLPYSADIMFI